MHFRGASMVVGTCLLIQTVGGVWTSLFVINVRGQSDIRRKWMNLEINYLEHLKKTDGVSQIPDWKLQREYLFPVSKLFDTSTITISCDKNILNLFCYAKVTIKINQWKKHDQSRWEKIPDDQYLPRSSLAWSFVAMRIGQLWGPECLDMKKRKSSIVSRDWN